MRLSREARRRLERRRRRLEKKQKTAHIVTRTITISLVVALSLNSTAYAGTVDDLRELIGKQRMDALYSKDEQSKILLEYNKIEQHNRLARMFQAYKGVDTSSDVEEKREELKSDIDETSSSFIASFSSGAKVEDVLKTKTTKNVLEYKESKLKQFGEEITMEVIENVWEDDYNNLMELLSELNTYIELGDVGVDMKSPVRNKMMFTSLYGIRIDPITGEDGDVHWGLDFRGAVGDDVLAQWNGVITRIYESEEGGVTIEIKHGEDVITRYLHLSAVHVEVGDEVSQYDLIGEVGDTGRVTGPHLHFEVKIDGEFVNPVLLYGRNGEIALKNYLDEFNLPYTRDIQDVIARIKDRPSFSEGVTLEPEEMELIIGKREVDYTKEGEVPEGSTKITIEEGFSTPKPSDEILD